MDHEFEIFLSRYPPAVAKLARQARALILEAMPGIIEQLDPSANLIGYGINRTYKGLICGITLHKEHINLMFAHGASLPDPESLLSGTGKQARHIKIQKESDLNQPGVRTLLVTAITTMKSRSLY